MRGRIVALGLVLASCSTPAELEPRSGRGQGGEWVWIRGEDFVGHGGVVVSFGGVAGHAVVIESDRLLRVSTPTVPPELRGEPVEVELHFADGEVRTLSSSYVFEVGPLDVRD
jgi:hypothetical protein